jgi:hypothetical protein
MSADPRDRTSRFVPVAGLAGVVVGHWIAYRIAFPQAPGRSIELARSGHGYWFAAIVLAIACAVLAFANTIVRHVRLALGRGAPDEARSVRSTGIRLAALQASLFVVQEVLERLRVQDPLSILGQGRLLLIGISIQMVVALAIALMLALLGRTAAAIARAVTRLPNRTSSELHRPGPAVVAPVQRTGRARLGPRAPPLSLGA